MCDVEEGADDSLPAFPLFPFFFALLLVLVSSAPHGMLSLSTAQPFFFLVFSVSASAVRSGRVGLRESRSTNTFEFPPLRLLIHFSFISFSFNPNSSTHFSFSFSFQPNPTPRTHIYPLLHNTCLRHSNTTLTWLIPPLLLLFLLLHVRRKKTFYTRHGTPSKKLYTCESLCPHQVTFNYILNIRTSPTDKTFQEQKNLTCLTVFLLSSS